MRYVVGFFRCPIKFCFLIALGLVASFLPVSRVAAWSAPGDASVQRFDTTAQASCSFWVDRGPGPIPQGDTVRFGGVCSGVPGQVTAASYLAAGRTAADLVEFKIYTHNGGNRFAAWPGATSMGMNLTVFTSAACAGVTDCATYSGTAIGSGHWLTNVPSSDEAGGIGIIITSTTGGCSNSCPSINASDSSGISYSSLNGYTAPRFYWSQPWVSVPSNACMGVKIAVQYKGQALSVADYDDTLFPKNGTVDWDDFIFVATVTGVDWVANPSSHMLSYRWPGSGGRWTPLFAVIDRAVVTNGSVMTFRIGVDKARFLSQVQFRCMPTIDSAAPARRFLAFWDPGNSINTPNWKEFESYQSACHALTMLPPSGSVAPGAVAEIPFSLTSTLGLNLTAFAYGVAGFSPSTSPQIPVLSYGRFGGVTGGPPATHGVMPTSGGVLRFTLPSSVESPVPYADFVFACEDDQVSGMIVAGSADLGLSGTVDDAPDPTCWEQGGMSLTSPSSWISGGAKMLTCLAQALFIPDSEALRDTFSTTLDDLSDRPPWVVVAVVIDFGSDLYDSFASTSGTGCFGSGAIPGIVESQDVCAGAGINISAGQRDLMAMLLVVPMVIGMASQILALVGTRVQVLEDDNGQTSWNI